ncbi:hypothetical protein LTR11_011634 [Exophiala xenobiotica]|nr:hypothetical protein LTS06_010515 [Exophiala xenobiotica]KAK5344518.1 hypothetical protein LTR61_011715 [Exophiala xenobiotica]KAK5356188.1 hypothetical protein LTR11_011634 [Exophiala xenobiotica]
MVTKVACLGRARVSELRRLQGHDGMDFASAVQQVLSATDHFSNPPRPLTVDEMDHTPDRLVFTCVFSSPKLREVITIGYTEVFDELVRVLRRLPSVGVKWMICLILKNLRSVEIPVTKALRAFHFLMPDLLQVRTSLSRAVQLLDDVISHLPVSPPSSLEKSLREATRTEIEPRIGTMIALQAFDKARSIRHCCQLVGREECVLVGELLVWNHQMGQIMPFYKIRRYVHREGRQLGCARDSPPCEDEHLMIMFYDVLLLDNILCLHEPLRLRRRRLETLISSEAGQAEIGEGVKIDLRLAEDVARLHNEMTSAIAKGWEGLVVKDWNAPYLSSGGNIHQVKLKEDYIPGLGDSTHLVGIGG